MSGQTVSQDWFNICVVNKSIFVSNWKKKHEWELININLLSVSSCVRNLSSSSSLCLIQKTKPAKERKVEEELTPQLSNHKKRPQWVVVSDVSLVGNADVQAKVLKHQGLKFRFLLSYLGYMKEIKAKFLLMLWLILVQRQ